VPDRDPLSRVFAALADPTRREILARLKQGPATVTELAEPLPISMPAVSRHLKVLAAAGLISRGREAQWRSSSLQVEPMREAMTWMEQLGIVWEHRLERLDQHLAAQRRTPQPQPRKSPTPKEADHE
jgi:DNA-binding transcriptional ArsR family regulator